MSFDSTNVMPLYHPHAGDVADGSRIFRDIVIDTPDNLVFRRPQRFDGDWAAAEFKKHAKKWKRETAHLSSPAEKYLHQSYARIIGLGWPAAAFILKSMTKEMDDWFYALRAITGANPVTASMAGDMRQMTAAWLKWGEALKLI